MDPFTIGTKLVALVAGVVQGVRKITARKAPSVDEIVAQMERDRRAQYERLKAAAAASLPDEKTPTERPSKHPRGLR